MREGREVEKAMLAVCAALAEGTAAGERAPLNMVYLAIGELDLYDRTMRALQRSGLVEVCMPPSHAALTARGRAIGEQVNAALAAWRPA